MSKWKRGTFSITYRDGSKHEAKGHLSPCGRWAVVRKPGYNGGWTDIFHRPSGLRATSLGGVLLRDAKPICEALTDELGPVGAIDDDHAEITARCAPIVAKVRR